MGKNSLIDWDVIGPQEFTEVCEAVLRYLGFSAPVILDGTGDKGRDILCELSVPLGDSYSVTTKWVVQCKHYKGRISKTMLNEDLVKAKEHRPDFWLLMTSSKIPASVFDWLKSVERNDFNFRIIIMEGSEIGRFLLEDVDLNPGLVKKLFGNKGEIFLKKVMALMGRNNYTEALSQIRGSTYRGNARLLYLEACCLSKLASFSEKDRTSYLETAFMKLEEAFKCGYVKEVNHVFGWPQGKTFQEIYRDPELEFLRNWDEDQFVRLLDSYGYSEVTAGAGCFVENTLVAVNRGTTKKICLLNPGDIIETIYSPFIGETVNRVFKSFANRFVSINGAVDCTLDQPFLTNSGWKKAGDLYYGDILLKRFGFEPVLSLNYYETDLVVFMLNMEKGATFYANGFVVHNKEGA